ncbi:hypothetical protein MGG_16188 [Pyricularia oryzae 70-15]|uniref:Uncharacterized protein n=3 Tax=Pyricularia oryzae TaxID=318829 RepID=G4MMH0_PYRO7|nr:uncharacterized protein MGG_16188 [Pyricularia oryzae 70-15]EHA56948.1 hypothetical protein MGG_16188 [Pyricularia oryzae 70-15]ELQ43698.1 hypothetical protein OOU_Y34scaffold00140g107 [Pyricularia oryzae Y34]KAI7916065.1 hypothetical protein M9X92_008075 [Pyricularia oryzae]KAI7917584.1 hypothetical protein M0657_007981 [Pyricularia oryzae]
MRFTCLLLLCTATVHLGAASTLPKDFDASHCPKVKDFDASHCPKKVDPSLCPRRPGGTSCPANFDRSQCSAVLSNAGNHKRDLLVRREEPDLGRDLLCCCLDICLIFVNAWLDCLLEQQRMRGQPEAVRQAYRQGRHDAYFGAWWG